MGVIKNKKYNPKIVRYTEVKIPQKPKECPHISGLRGCRE
jgi:hypothetical protein